MDGDAPKFDLKTMILPIILLGHKKVIDLENPVMLNGVKIAMATAAVLALTIYFILWKLVERKADNTKIWVPPKAQPTIPFLPKPEPPKPEDYVETTYEAHEVKLLRESVQSLFMACGIAVFVSFKFNLHISCLIQSVMIPVNLWDSPIFQKYLLGKVSPKPTYDELLAAPGTAPKNNSTEKVKDSPKVEQLPDDEDTKVISKKKTNSSKNVQDID
eukprot:gene1648-3187_t